MNKTYSNRIQNLKTSATIAISTLAGELRAQGRDILSFSTGEPDFDTPELVKDFARLALNKGLTKYTPVSGVKELKEAIAYKLQNENDLSYSPNQILVSNGAKQALFNAFAALIQKDDEVLIPTPYWVTYPELVTYHGGKNVFLETTIESDFKVSAKQIKEAINSKTKILVLTTPSNPTGMVYSKSELKEIAEVLKGSNVWVIADEIYEKLVYEGKFVSAGTISNDMFERVITINGLSKSAAMTGWRIGYLASSDTHLVKLMTNLQSQCTSNVNSITQYASIPVLKGELKKEIKAMRNAFLERRDIAVKMINNINGLSVKSPQGAFYLFIDIRGLKRFNGNSMEFCTAALNELNLAFVPGSAFGMDGFIRMSFACSNKAIKKGLTRLEAFKEC